MSAEDAPDRPDRVSVVLPVYKNRPELPDLHRRLTDVLATRGGEYELVFVDDAGGDGSREWLRECRATDHHVVLVEMAANGGQHPAVLAGLARARGDRCVVMDADLQDPPEAVPTLLHALGREDAVVFARRTARHQSHTRHWTGLAFKRFVRWLAASRVPGGTGMFFAASRRVVAAALEQGVRVTYLPFLLDQTGAPMRAIDVPKVLRPDVPSAYTAAKRWRLAVGAIRQALDWRRARRRRRPVRPRSGSTSRD